MAILSISGSVTAPSRTTNLLDAVDAEIERQTGIAVEKIRLSHDAPALFRALRSNQLDDEGRRLVSAVEQADVLVVGSPVYRASYTGALKHLFDLVDYRSLAGKPVLLVATGGTPLHGLMIDHQLRPLFAFFNALTLPTSIYATEAHFSGHGLESPEIHARIERAVGELVPLLPKPLRPAGNARPLPIAAHA